MNPPSSPAQARLGAAARQRDRSARLRTLFLAGGCALLALLLAASVDYWLVLPSSLRWIGFSVIVTLIALGTLRWIHLQRRPSSLKEAALEVEQTRPDAGCEVSTAAEYLTGERKITQAYEHDLVTALEQKAAGTVERTPIDYRRRFLLPALAAGVVILLLAAFTVIFPAASTALVRASAPWSKAAFSQIEVKPGTSEVPIGKNFDLLAHFKGRIPAKAQLQVRSAGQANWTAVLLTGPTNGTFAHTLPAVKESFAYRIFGGDAVSDEYSVTAYVPPEVKSVLVHLEPPAYTRLHPTDLASADVAIVRGTTASFFITPTIELSRARLQFTNGTSVDLKRAANGLWTAPVPITKDDEFHFELFDAKGRKGGDAIAHRFTAIPDEPPKVDFEVPGGDTRATATNRVPFKLQASDDFGVAAVKIIYHRLGSPEQELVVDKWVAQGKEAQAELEFDLTPLKLNQYDVVSYYAEARDKNTLDGPGIGRSPTYFIEITDLEGSKTPPQKPTQDQKVNLLVVQKQIIADTAELAAKAPEEKFKELALRQRDAMEFGKLYQKALTETGAPMVAQGAMNSAVAAMGNAAAALDKQQRAGALPPEEEALAQLYQVLKLMPELKSLPLKPPTLAEKKPEKQPQEEQPPAIRVVLDAIKRQKKEPPDQQEIEQLLSKIQQLSQQQAALSAAAAENPGALAVPEQPDRNAPQEQQETDEAKDQPEPSAEQAQASSPEQKNQLALNKAQKGQKGKKAQAQKGQKGQKGQQGKQGQQGQQGQGQQGQQGQGQQGQGQQGQGQGQPGQGQQAGKQPGPGKRQGQGNPQQQAKNQDGQKTDPKTGEKSEAQKREEAKNPNDPKQPQPKDGDKEDPADKDSQEKQEPQLADLAPKQDQLSKEARELAERIERLAGKNSRQGHNAGQRMGEAAQKMAQAAKAMRSGNGSGAGAMGSDSTASMGAAATLLESLLSGRPELGDVTSEDAPRQYEGAIADYFKRLSHAQ